MPNMLRRQAYFAIISFVVLCVGLAVAHFAFGISFTPAHQQTPVVQPSTNLPSDSIPPPFWFRVFIFIFSLTMTIGGSMLFYMSWFNSIKARENLEHMREFARQGKLISLRHDYTNMNITAYLWFARLFSPFLIFLGFALLLSVVNGFHEVVFRCC
jgi:hypothetical protein